MSVLDPERLIENSFPEKEIPLSREVLRLAWPAMTMNAFQVINSFIDRRFVGGLGRDALAAVGASSVFLFLLIAVAFALATGTTALVARAYGAKDMNSVIHATRQSILLSLFLGFFGVLASYLLIDSYLFAIHLEPATARNAAIFLKISSLGIAPLFVLNTLAGAFRGVGDTIRPMLIMIAIIACHLTGDFILIGYNGVPNLGIPTHHGIGIRGAAIALTISQFVGMALYFIVFARTGIEGALYWEKPNLDWQRRIIRLAVPASFQAMLRVTSMMVFTAILARTIESTVAVAALNIGIIAESIAFMPGLGYSVAAASLVGQYLGAKRPDKAERIGWAAAYQTFVLMSILGAVFFIFARQLSAWFITDPAVIDCAVSYLRITALTEPFLGLGIVFSGALQGAGDTVRPTWATLISMWAVRVPLAFIFAVRFGHHAVGAWWPMTFSTFVGGVLMAYLFKRGHWKRVRV